MKVTAKKERKLSHQCHGPAGEDIEGLEKILIVGSPNVGKSALFNKLTGAYVTVSNYPGTTVTIDKGKCRINGREFGIIDSPGMYSLTPITEEEHIAKLILFEEHPKIVLHVVDAKNLERMLPLTLQLIEADLPVILVINMMDEAERLRIHIDVNHLESQVRVPVVPIVATSGRGIDDLMKRMSRYVMNSKAQIRYEKNIESSTQEIQSLLKSDYAISKRAVSLLLLQMDDDLRRAVKEKETKSYHQITEIIESTRRKYSHPLNYVIRMRLQREASKIIGSSTATIPVQKIGFREKLSRVMIRPLTGIPILFAIVYFGLYQFVGVLGAGELVDLIEGKIFGEKIVPVVTELIMNSISYRPIQELIVGEYGIVTLGITYAVAIILPIVGTFFLLFSVLEDTGYLPRMSLLLDRIFKRIGLSGRAVIPMVLGLGCDTMATMVTRTQETIRERVICTLLLALAVPCSAQLGVIFAILSAHPRALIIWFVVIWSNFLLVGFLASKILPGEQPSFYMELPPLRLPIVSNILIKTYTRMVWYFREIFPLFILVSILIWIFQLVGIFQLVIRGLEPIVNFIGLPNETSKVFLFGFFRRDYGAAGLYAMQNALTGIQLTVASVTLTLFIPCVAQFLMMLKERGVKTAVSIFIFVLLFAFCIGFVLNQILISFKILL